MEKKRFLYTSVLALALVLSACGGKTNKSSSSSNKSSASSAQSSVVSSSNATNSSKSSSVSSTSVSSSEVTPATSSTVSSEPSSSAQPQSSAASSSGGQQTTSTPQQSSSTPAQSSSEVPVSRSFYAVYDGREIEIKPDDDQLAENQLAQFKATLGNVEKGKSITILDPQKNVMAEQFGAEPGDNNVIVNEGNYTIHNDATNAFVLVKTWESGWTNFYISGYEEEVIPEPVYKVVGVFGEEAKWDYANGIEFVDATDPEDTSYVKQLKATFNVNAGDQFKVTDGTNWFGGEIFEGKDDFEVIHSNDETNNNIKANAKGSVDLYFKTKADQSRSIAIVFIKEEVPVQEPVYKVVGTFGEENKWDYANGLSFVEVLDNDPSCLKKLKAEFHISANNQFKVTDGTNWYGGEVLEANAYFDVVSGGEDNNNIKAKEAGQVELLFKIKSDGFSITINFVPDVAPLPEAYYAVYGGHEYKLEADTAAVLAENQLAQFKVSLGNIQKDQTISILDKNKAALTNNFNAEPGNNNVVENEGIYKIHNDADSAYVVVKTWNSGWINFYVSGYEEEPVPEPFYKVVGMFGENDKWNYADGIEFVDVTDPNNALVTKQLKAEFAVKKDDQFKVTDGTNWYGGEVLENNASFDKLEGGNIKAKADGQAELLFKVMSDNSYVITINFVPDEVPVPETYYAVYDGNEIALQLQEVVLAENQVAEFKATLGNVEKAKSIVILDKNKQALSQNFNALPGDNNVIEAAGAYTIHNDAENAYVVVKTWNSGWTNFYVSGYEEEPVPEPVYKIVGQFGEDNKWSYENGLDLNDVSEPQGAKVFKATFTAAANDQFKVTDGANWYGGEKLVANDDFEIINADEGKGNIKVKAAGQVELTFTVNNGDFAISLNFTPTEQPVEPPVEPAGDYKLISDIDHTVIDYESSKVTLVDVTDPDKVALGTYIKEYKVSALNIVKGAKYKVSDGQNEYGATELEYSNAFEGDDGYIKAKANGQADLYFKETSTGHSIYMAFTPAYRVVGTFDGNNRWAYAEGISFQDATDPADVAADKYVSQIKAEFPVKKGDEFKITDDNDWFGADVFENHFNFDELEGGNIKSKAEGMATVYLKTYANGSRSAAIVLETQKVVVNLTVTKADVGADRVIYMVGDFTNWELNENALMFNRGPDDTWLATIEIYAYQNFAYKLVIVNTEGVQAIQEWENGDNQIIYVEQGSDLTLVWH